MSMSLPGKASVEKILSNKSVHSLLPRNCWAFVLVSYLVPAKDFVKLLPNRLVTQFTG